jgi:2-isopropylmalate synthase
MKKPEVSIDIFDTTMRDGAQSLPEENQFEPGQKEHIANEIARLGVSVIEAGFPANENDYSEVCTVAKTVGQSVFKSEQWSQFGKYATKERPVRIAGLSRSCKDDIETTWDAISSASMARIHTFIPTDQAHIKAKFPDKSEEEVLKMGIESVKHAVQLIENHPSADIEFSAEASTTTDLGFLERVIKEAIQAGADVINVPDTVGERNPFWMRDFYYKIIEWSLHENPDVTISAHNHNDLYQAVSNSLALVFAAGDYAVQKSAKVNIQIESTICGIGERAGNADIFPIIAGLYKFTPKMESTVKWGFNPGQSLRVATLVMKYADLTVPRQSAIVGRDTNVHRSAIHSDGIIKAGENGHRLYTPHDPTFWGHNTDARHEDGKFQGAKTRLAIYRSI